MSTYFTSQLLKWNESSNDRPMPWKGETDPYKIWLSEIILQQTRVEQGWAYYEKFVHHFPTIQDLAKAKDEKVFKLWEGLGYYNRCRNLLFTARHIVQTWQGKFPNNYDTLLELKGVGPYTASAIASFAFNLPYAVVDGNVFRVLARFYGIHTPTDNKEGLLQFNTLAKQNLSTQAPGIYNQALMDFGATVCKPMAPICASCVMQTKCMAFKQNLVNQLPVKLKVIQKKKRYFDFFIFTYKDQVLLQKRQEQDIWRDLFQFYLVENERVVVANDAYFKEVLVNQLNIPTKNTRLFASSKTFQQQLTHQLLQARFFSVHLTAIPKVFSKALWVKLSTINKYPFPKIIHQFLEAQSEVVK
jgi:A/G-specific adenine glycosylase